jgi:hypothetical protein
MPKDEVDGDDPMEAMGVALPGDTTEPMAEAFVEEYMLMGYGDKELLALFHDRFYMATNMVLREKGEEWVKALIQRVRTGGIPQIKVTTTEVPERFEV